METHENSSSIQRAYPISHKPAVHSVRGIISTGGATVAEILSAYLIELAHHSFEKCIEDRKKDIVKTDGNNYSSHAIAVHILVHNALEALINELIAIPNMPSAISEEPVKEWLYDASFLAKFVIVPRLAWQKTFDTGKEPYQSLQTLNKLRNYLVHYKMEFLPITSLPRGLHLLQDRKVLLDSPNSGFNWLQQVSSSKTALWSLNTAAEVAKELLSFTSSEVHKLFESSANNFQIISQKEYLDMIMIK